MANSSRPDGVNKMLDAAKRVLDILLPGPSRTPTRAPRRRVPIPPTLPPRLLRKPFSAPPRPSRTDEPRATQPSRQETDTLGAPAAPAAETETAARPASPAEETETAARPASPAEETQPPAPEPGVPPESVAGFADAVPPRTGREERPYEQLTKAELYELAQRLDIPGRSTMSKQQLIEALRRH